MITRVLAYLTPPFAIGLVFYISATDLLDGAILLVVYAAVFILTVLVAGWELISFRENQRLARQLDEKSIRLDSLSSNYEKRFNEREGEMALAGEVSRKITRVHDLDSLLREAVDAIRSYFDLYYVQIYLVDAGRRNLVLSAGTSPFGEELQKQQHRMALDFGSINGTAALERRPVVVTDTSTSPIFRANPLLPDTRSEMAVPLISGDRVVGILDMQSSQSKAFREDRLVVFEAIAGQLAVAIDNSRLFAQSERTKVEMAEYVRRLTQTNWTEFLNAVERGEHIGYTFDLDQVLPLQAGQHLDTDSSHSVPILVSGQQVGSFRVDGEQSWTPDDLEFINVISRLIAQRAENLRAMAQADRYRMEAEKVAQRLTSQAWDNYFQRSVRLDTGYIYDRNMVLPLGDVELEPGMTVQYLRVGEKHIGEISIGGMDRTDQDAADLLEIVSEQLSAHLEGLRLIEESQLAEQTAVKFQLGIEQSSDAVFITDVDGKIVYVNPAFEEIYGYEAEEAMGHTPRLIKSGLIAQERYTTVWTDVHSQEVTSGELVNKTKDGRNVPVESSSAPILDEDGNVLGYLAIHRDISERKKIEKALAKRATELASVARVSMAVSSLRDPQDILQAVVDLTKESFGLYHAQIYLVDDATDDLSLAAGAGGVGQQMVATGWNIPLFHEDSLVAQAARTRRGVIVNDVHSEAGHISTAMLPETRAEMAIPLIIGDSLLGVLDVHSMQADSFSQEDMNIQMTLASQVAVALQNARQFKETQSVLAETEALYAITSAATQSLDLDETLAQLLEHTLMAVGLDAGLVSLLDEASGRLYLHVHRNLPNALVSKLETEGMEDTLCDLVYQQKSAMILEDFERGAPIDISGLVRLGFRSYQGVPLEAKGKIMGTLCAFGYDTKPDLEGTLELMHVAGRQIGIAIENAQLFRETQRQAEYEAMVNAISQRIQSTTTVEGALQVAVRELGRALGSKRTLVQLKVGEDDGSNGSSRTNENPPGQ